jgi:uncharacterized integral membrane protein
LCVERHYYALTRLSTARLSTGIQVSAAPLRRSPGERTIRHRKRARLYIWACLLVGLVVGLIALIAANTRAVKLNWVFGSTHASLVWIILASAVLGWLLGIATSTIVRHRTRREV